GALRQVLRRRLRRRLPRARGAAQGHQQGRLSERLRLVGQEPRSNPGRVVQALPEVTSGRPAAVALDGIAKRFGAVVALERVALARAVAPSPALLLLDEPLSALDARVRVALRAEIKALQRRLGITTIMVTHDQEEALTMADRIVVMNHGVVEQIGTPFQTYTEPASLFVARFVGRMNVLAAVASERPGWARVGRLELRHRAGAARPAGTRLALAIRPEEIR